MSHNTRQSLVLSLAALTLLLFQPNQASAQYSFQTLDVPNAVQGTYLYALNEKAVVGQGLYADFTGPGAIFVGGTFYPYNSPNSNSTYLGGINDEGAISGGYTDSNGLGVGFVVLYGNEFDFTATANNIYTQPGGINDFGVVAGTYIDPQSQAIRAFTWFFGATTPFDFPGSGILQTQAFQINNRGQIAGWYQDSKGSHGYTRKGSKFGSIDYPGAYLTRAFGINDKGTVVGYFQTASHGPATGFILTGKSFATVSMPGAVWTVPQAINNHGQIAGYYQAADASFHGFLATPGGK